jgi:hypothetical protein
MKEENLFNISVACLEKINKKMRQTEMSAQLSCQAKLNERDSVQ